MENPTLPVESTNLAPSAEFLERLGEIRHTADLPKGERAKAVILPGVRSVYLKEAQGVSPFLYVNALPVGYVDSSAYTSVVALEKMLRESCGTGYVNLTIVAQSMLAYKAAQVVRISWLNAPRPPSDG